MENYTQLVPQSKNLFGAVDRHGDKVNDKTITDFDISLTTTGFFQAKTEGEALVYFLGKDRLANVTDVNVRGSDRLRTLQTAQTMRSAMGFKDRGESTTELGFEDGQLGKSEFGKKMLTAFKAGRLVEYMINESDFDKKSDTEDNITYSYSKTASNVATYLKGELANFENGGELQLSLAGTHQSIVECFLAKLITLTKGKQETDKFIEAISKQGSNFLEGIKYSINKNAKTGEIKFLVMYKKPYVEMENGKEVKKVFSFYEYVTPELLNLIIEDTSGEIAQNFIKNNATIYEKPANFDYQIEEKVKADIRELVTHETEFKAADQTINYLSELENSNTIFTNKLLIQIKETLKVWHPQERLNIESIKNFSEFDNLSQGDRWWFKQQAGKAVQQLFNSK